ncbi:hypothetical protein [Parvularcula lutaonensis]|uniref:Uncharacterized protein n=1 Tax=Parvularcula lutaonensis TaxID=491923 RepID=A0ABV7MC33_9PROT|nr:hypothetical protein [Parvularcula lutaonensis]
MDEDDQPLFLDDVYGRDEELRSRLQAVDSEAEQQVAALLDPA